MEPAPLIVIVGETASGKTALAIELAEKFGGEIICADSRTVYKGMDIGTAKPTAEERAKVPHHLLDVVAPDEPFTVADFKRLAEAAIKEIASRGKVPIMVGGSGLYVDAVIYGYRFGSVKSDRSEVNPRHLAEGAERPDKTLRSNTLILGLKLDREVLEKRITDRINVMVDAGFLGEVSRLQAKYPGSKALDAPGYKAFLEHLSGQLTLDEAKALFARNDMQLAKRQRTWFKRNNNIHWTNNREKIVEIATTFLSKNQSPNR